jgi:hypothetical protein
MDAVERDRRDYTRGSLDVGDVDPDPLRQLERWIADAVDAEVGEPNAMTLATVDAMGSPTHASCCCAASPTRRSCGSRTAAPRRACSSAPSRMRRSCSTGSRSSVRCGCAVRSSSSMMRRATSTSSSRPRGSRLSAWASAPVAADPLPRRLRASGRCGRGALRRWSTTSRGRRTGAGTRSRPSASSCGRVAVRVVTTGSASMRTVQVAGRWRGSSRDGALTEP